MNLIQKLSPVFIVLTIIGFATGEFFFYKYNKATEEIQTIKNQPDESKVLIDEVSRLIALPEEDPAIATINGNKMLIYTQAKKVILYDPVAKKILDVASVNIGSSSAAQSIKIVLRNGTTTTGLTTKAEADVKKSITNAQIVTKENASKSNFEKSIVVALNIAFKDSAAKLAKDLNFTVGELPSAESKPKEGDILVILGKDRI